MAARHHAVATIAHGLDGLEDEDGTGREQARGRRGPSVRQTELAADEEDQKQNDQSGDRAHEVGAELPARRRTRPRPRGRSARGPESAKRAGRSRARAPRSHSRSCPILRRRNTCGGRDRRRRPSTRRRRREAERPRAGRPGEPPSLQKGKAQDRVLSSEINPRQRPTLPRGFPPKYHRAERLRGALPPPRHCVTPAHVGGGRRAAVLTSCAGKDIRPPAPFRAGRRGRSSPA
jgi:hypothetical protein